jgi:hypothetical protein
MGRPASPAPNSTHIGNPMTFSANIRRRYPYFHRCVRRLQTSTDTTSELHRLHSDSSDRNSSGTLRPHLEWITPQAAYSYHYCYRFYSSFLCFVHR